MIFTEISPLRFVCENWYQQRKFWNSFRRVNEALDIWIQTCEVLLVFGKGKKKKSNPRKIKWKKYLQNPRKIPVLGLHQKLTLWSFNANLVPRISFPYIFKIALRTRLPYFRSFKNFESSLILQFFKCHETTKISPSL